MAKPLREALIAAADWLEANPERHIKNSLAVDDLGSKVDPTDPSATCFCAVGRLACELQLTRDRFDPGYYQQVTTAMRSSELEGSAWSIVEINDIDPPFRSKSPVCEFLDSGNPAAIHYMRSLAAQIKEPNNATAE